MKRIRYSTQTISPKDIKSVKDVLKKDFLTQGPTNIKFEKKLSQYLGCKHVLSVSNASNALFLACKVVGIKKDSIVWCSTITFISSISCAYQLEAKVEFLDIDSYSFNIDLKKLEQKLKIVKKIPDLIIVTHLGGSPLDLLKLEKLQKKYKFKIIEDASHALGSSFGKKKIGNSKISECVVFSFHPVKSITTGEGGALATNNKKFYIYAKSLRSHGLDRVKKNKSLKSDLDYDIYKLGHNFRLSDINAALGISQLKKLNLFINKRNLIANYYKNLFKFEKKIIDQQIPFNSKSSYHLYIVKIKNLNLKLKNKLNQIMKKNNIEINYHYVPIYKFSFIKNKKIKKFLNSEKYHREAISLPIHNNLEKKDVKKVSSIVINFIKKYC
jgi:dTDP-4-amino-4,6-dideoxygalactose transaminase